MSVLSNLANYIQGELNDIANGIVFYVTDSEQKFDDAFTQMELSTDTFITPTAVLLKRVFATKQDDYVYGKMLETYSLEILGFQDNKDEIERVFDVFTEQQNTNDFDATDNLKKNHGKIAFVGLVNSKNGTNKHFISYRYDFTWDYVLGSVISDASSLSINGTVVDFLGLAFSNDKILIPNKAFGTNTLASTNGQQLAITFPINNDTAGLFSDIIGDTYNKTYTLVWSITGFASVTLTMVLRGGTVNYNRDELISFTATFEKALSRTEVLVNNQRIPILSFSFNRDYNVESIVKVEEVESQHISSAATVTIRFAHDKSTQSNNLLSDIINHNLDREYVLDFDFDTVQHTDTYILRSGTHQFEQSGELLYEVTFVKVV